MTNSYWESPDGKIKKNVICVGTLQFKPTEGTRCKLQISDSSIDLDQFSTFTVGDVDGDIGRQLEICVTTMFEKEKSSFVVNLDNHIVNFTLDLMEMKFDGFLYDWDAKKKYDYSNFQNDQGKKHFKEDNIREAGFRFNKGLKIICSIPIDVQDTPSIIDTVPLKDISQLKATLYNNLASCFFRKEQWHLVINFCNKVFLYDKDNVKASYRAAISYLKDRNFEKADEYLKKVLEQEPYNKSALEHHKFVKVKLREANVKCDKMAKKMISDILGSV